MSEMMNKGAELETINNASAQNRAKKELVYAQKGVRSKKSGYHRMAVACFLTAAGLGAIGYLVQMGAMAYWLGSVAACAVTLKLGMVIGGKEVK